MNSLIEGPKLDSLLEIAGRVVDVPGDFAECGVYKGGTIKALGEAFPKRKVIGFDTFHGLPKRSWREEEWHQVGEFSDAPYFEVRELCAGVPNLQLVRGFFPDSAAPFDGARFALVHIDFDFYLSTLAAIDWFLPRMNAGGVLVFDDYGWERCLGVQQAIEERGLLVVPTANAQVAHWVGA